MKLNNKSVFNEQKNNKNLRIFENFGMKNPGVSN